MDPFRRENSGTTTGTVGCCSLVRLESFYRLETRRKSKTAGAICKVLISLMILYRGVGKKLCAQLSASEAPLLGQASLGACEVFYLGDGPPPYPPASYHLQRP